MFFKLLNYRFKKNFIFPLIVLSSFLCISSKVSAEEPKELMALYIKAIDLYFNAAREEDQSKKKLLYKEALDKTDFILKIAPNYSKALSLRSEIKLYSNVSLSDPTLTYQRDLEGALKDINKAIKIDPQQDDYFNQRGKVYNKIWEITNLKLNSFTWSFSTGGDINNCKNIKYYSYCDKKLDEERKLELKNLLNKIRKDAYENAINDYQTAIDLRKKNVNSIGQMWIKPDGIYFSRGYLYFQNKEHKKAIDDFNQAIRYEERDNFFYRTMRSLANIELGNIKGFCRDYNFINNFDPSAQEYEWAWSSHQKLIKENCS